MSRKRGNGEGSITKRKDGRWMARYMIHTGKGPERRYIYGRTRQEVSEKLSKALSDRIGVWSSTVAKKPSEFTSSGGSTMSCGIL